VSEWPAWMALEGADVLVRVKAVSGASGLLAEAAGVAPRDVVLESGPSQPQKCFRLRSADPTRVAAMK